MYVDVYLPISIEKSFSYLVPNNLKEDIREGQIVYVPFGKRTELAYVNKINKKSIYNGKIKSIQKIASSAISDNHDIKKTIDWMERYFLTYKGLILKNIFSHLLNKNFYLKKLDQNIAITNKGCNAIKSNNIKGKNRINIMNFLLVQKTWINQKKLSKISSSYNNTIKTLLRDKYIKTKKVEFDNNPLHDIEFDKKHQKIKLSNKQNSIYKNLLSELKNDFSVNLIHGVTGSGKTEIYMKLTEEILPIGIFGRLMILSVKVSIIFNSVRESLFIVTILYLPFSEK